MDAMEVEPELRARICHAALSVLRDDGAIHSNGLMRETAVRVFGAENLPKAGGDRKRLLLNVRHIVLPLHNCEFIDGEWSGVLTITPKGLDSLERYPDAFGPAFMKNELAQSTRTPEAIPTAQEYWASLGKKQRRKTPN